MNAFPACAALVVDSFESLHHTFQMSSYLVQTANA
jgi:hypothetical protein